MAIKSVCVCVCVCGGGGGGGGGSLVPRPCAFVACSTKFAQRAWARSSRDVCRSRNFTSHQIWPRRVAALVVEITTNGVGRT